MRTAALPLSYGPHATGPSPHLPQYGPGPDILSATSLARPPVARGPQQANDSLGLLAAYSKERFARYSAACLRRAASSALLGSSGLKIQVSVL